MSDEKKISIEKTNTRKECLAPCHRFLGGGEPIASSPAFLFRPNPNATFGRSAGAGVLPCEDDSMTVDVIRENPALGAGEPAAEAFADIEVPLEVR